MNTGDDQTPNSGSSNEEVTLRKTTPVFLNSFNQPTYLARIVAQLLENGFERIVVCDNGSKSSKLLEMLAIWEANGPVRVMRIGENIGPHRTFQRVLSTQDSPFIFSDPDVELPENLATDFLSRLRRVSRKYRCTKIGPALAIPDADEGRDVVMTLSALGTYSIAEWEKRFWQVEIEKDVYRADLDTTFFYWNSEVRIDPRRLYNMVRSRLRPRRFIRFVPHCELTAIRIAGRGFTLRHLPWYKDDQMPVDERDFYRQAAARWSSWVR